jgi:hypothetical protein
VTYTVLNSSDVASTILNESVPTPALDPPPLPPHEIKLIMLIVNNPKAKNLKGFISPSLKINFR